MKKILKELIKITTIFLITLSASCSDAGDLIGLALSPPSRKPIDKNITGVNNFFVDQHFGSISEQYSDIHSTLGLKYIRILMAWTDDVQPTPSSTPNYSFYDSIIADAPPGVEILVVLSHAPTWITNSSTWDNGNPRATWVNKWFKPTVERYKNNPRVAAFEIFNEPDLPSLEQDKALELTDPAKYFEMLSDAYLTGKSIAPGKTFIMAATSSIQRKFPTILDYNKSLRDLGADSYTDVWNVHYYATSYETVVTNNGVADFLNGISKPIWVTESGETGPNKQLAYVETAWPFLKDKISGIQRFYYYQYGETTSLENNFGLRTNDSSFPVSDLYLFLKDGTR